ncbi:MAG: serine protease [Collimonas sp.]|uniref:S1 family peptidase n=1 Tax=Collimonas sp. TaxID=1963772 RepID=UPI003267377B
MPSTRDTLRRSAIYATAALLAGVYPLPAAFADSPPATTPEKVFSQVSPRVWMVKADSSAEHGTRIGSAVLIAPSQFITACHVVDKTEKIVLSNGSTNINVDQVLHDPDRTRDLCLLRTTSPVPVSPIVIAPVNTLRVGQQVFAVSSPRGLELSLTDGLISALRVEPGSELPIIQSSTPVSAGSSGGGLFDDNGRLIGVIKSVASQTENFAFSYPAEWVTQLPGRYAKEISEWMAELQTFGVKFTADGNVIGSGYAAITDMGALPVAAAEKSGVEIAYKKYLLLAAPRTFIFTSDGKYGSFSDTKSIVQFAEDCSKRKVTCKLYAVDNAVVWQR